MAARPRPALQVLESLAQLLREHPDNAAASVILQQSSRRLLKVLFTGTPSAQIKSVCIALTCLVKRTGLLDVLEDEVADCLDQVSSSWKRYQLQNGTTLGDLQYQRSSSCPLFLALLFAVRNPGDSECSTQALLIPATLRGLDKRLHTCSVSCRSH